MRTLAGIWHKNREQYGFEIHSPDIGFVRELHRLDPHLYVTWNKSKERWIIVERGYQTGLDHIVMKVEDEGGGYRPLDSRTITLLKAARWKWNKGIKEFEKRLREEEDQEKAQQEKDFFDECHSIGDWYALQMMGIPHSQVPKKYEEVQV